MFQKLVNPAFFIDMRPLLLTDRAKALTDEMLKATFCPADGGTDRPDTRRRMGEGRRNARPVQSLSIPSDAGARSLEPLLPLRGP